MDIVHGLRSKDVPRAARVVDEEDPFLGWTGAQRMADPCRE